MFYIETFVRLFYTVLPMIYGAATYEKRYVEVIARHTIDGRCDPMIIIWDDGTRYNIDRVCNARRARCLKTSGYAIRYDVQINRQTKHLYHDEVGWFVETIERPAGSPSHPVHPI